MKPFPVTDSRDGARFAVRVAPRASRTAVTGVLGEGAEAAVKIALQAPPVEGRANSALVEFLAQWLNVRRSDVEIVAGQQGRNKTVLIRGRSAEEISAAIEGRLQSNLPHA